MGDLKFLWVSGNLGIRGDFAMLVLDAGTHAKGFPCVKKDCNQ